MNTLTYKGFSARVEFDAEDAILVGRIAGINDVVSFHADDAVGIVEAFHEAVDDYIETCAKVGKDPEKAYSGKLLLRVSPDLHRRVAVAAELSDKSINQLGEEALSMLVGPSFWPASLERGLPAGLSPIEHLEQLHRAQVAAAAAIEEVRGSTRQADIYSTG